MHFLIDCPATKVIRTKLLLNGNVGQFNISSIVEWLLHNLSKYNWLVDGIPGSVIFGTMCWFLWKWRNMFLFEGRRIPTEGRLTLIKSFSLAAHNSYLVAADCINSSNSRHNEILVRWSTPQGVWCALNINGVLKRNVGQAVSREGSIKIQPKKGWWLCNETKYLHCIPRGTVGCI